MQAQVEHLEAQEAYRDELREDINTLDNEAAGLRVLNKTLYDNMQAIKARITDVQAAEAICPLCGQPLGEEHKMTLLADLQVEGTQAGDTYRANKARLAEIGETIRQYRDEIEDIEVELRKLQALRDRAAALSVNLEASLSAADTARAERAELLAIEVMLNSGEYAQELQAQRESITGEIEALGYDSEAHSAARETLSAYSDYERRQHDLDTAMSQVPDVQAAIDNAEARRIRWLKVLAEEEAEVAGGST